MAIIIALIIEYARTIVIYIIFYSFIEILLPKSNFKKYVNLVMGLIMLIIILKPIAGILNQSNTPLQNQLTAIDTSLVQKVSSYEEAQYKELQNKMIIDNYKSQLTSQINTLVTRQINITILSVDIDVETNTESTQYGQVNSIKLKVKDSAIKTIPIEPIEIQIQASTADGQNSTESELSKNIKKIISDFYNMSSDNIYVIEV